MTKPTKRVPQGRANNAGQSTKLIDYVDLRSLSDEQIVDTISLRFKAERSLFHQYSINAGMIGALFITSTFLRKIKRGSIALDRIVDYSGNSRKWKSGMYKDMKCLIKSGFLDRKPAPRNIKGMTIEMSAKGRYILKSFCAKLRDINDGLSDPSNHPARYGKPEYSTSLVE